MNNQLSKNTINLISESLKLYNSIDIAEIIIFTKNLQYVGTYDSKESTKYPQEIDQDESSIKELKDSIESIGINEKKIVNFKLNGIGNDVVEEYICHVMDKFIMIYKLEDKSSTKHG
ncbi:uncharacterized protein KGF55_001358 [Candida pseudojiufengensis]|uniref:uncharacterized protein n=1 Tax=Candida pseudojiufengensis TaxID=497109 RepID=UPI0022244EC4|nr:uncharacterized protein KGF55_001358 [Candida pseudojiufengensis]KAI5965138.1 hypothetical protein KGF55_001358 [Candida pseudojiufengensis]